MRAAVLRNTGDEKLEVVDGIEPIPCGPTDVTIKIEATAIRPTGDANSTNQDNSILCRNRTTMTRTFTVAPHTTARAMPEWPNQVKRSQ